MSLEPIWRWLCAELMPAETSAYAEETKRHLLAGDAAQAEAQARALQDQAVIRIEAALAAVDGDARARRRLAGRIGTPNALEQLRDVLAMFKARDVLAALAARLAPHIRTLADEQLENVTALLDLPLVRRHDLTLFALLLAMSRL